MSSEHPIFPLAEGLYARFADDIPALELGEPNAFIDAVTPATAELLKFWFQNDYRDNRDINFHIGQRDAILAIVYAHEIIAAPRLRDLYAETASASLLGTSFAEISHPRNDHPKYAAKMATGTGKTWVLNALLVWQFLNHLADPADERFTSNFLLVAPGLIVYERLLDSFQGKLRGESRDFLTSDIYLQRELFVPDDHQVRIFGFLQSSVVTKSEIGRKVTGSGVVAITNWHLLAGQEDPDFLDDDEGAVHAPGRDIDVRQVIDELLPLTPGTSAGNSLEALDRRNLRGRPLEYLRDLGSLLVFNDEAHHIHTVRSAGDVTEVEWQKSLNAIAQPKGRRFIQIDFSATPYNESGRAKQKRYFDHIITDFDLPAAMKAGLVKSLALDKRSEIGALPDLDFRAVREGNRVVGLSEGQRVMLRAGLTKLATLEQQFASVDPNRHPKLLVICEETAVSPFVEEFLRESGLAEEDFLRVDSGKKSNLGPKEWEPVRERLFDIDRHPTPKVIISVLMLREGFDVNNICVIVPLRASGSGILLEQTIGRGLRLMWRGEPEIDALKRETRERIGKRLQPKNFFDLLFVVEHPAFAQFYDDLLGNDLVGSVGDDVDNDRATGDLERVGLREGYEQYDFDIPFVLREASEELKRPSIDPLTLPRSRFPVDDLLRMLGSGDRFVSVDAQSGTQYGDYKVDGGVMTATGYNDFLARLTNRITQAHGRSFVMTNRQLNQISEFPILQAYKPLLLGWVDRYIRRRMFGDHFDPLKGENWRVLLVPGVAEEISGLFGTKLVEVEGNIPVVGAEVVHRLTSEVTTLTVRESSAVEAVKCIYPKLRILARGGGLERFFIEWIDSDSTIEAFLKIDEYKHQFLRRPYLKADGMPALYSPDFLVRTSTDIYVVETKSDAGLADENVRRKERSALSWVEQLNRLEPEQRGNREWHYVLLGESLVRSWRNKNESASSLLAFAQLRPPEQSAELTLL